MPFETLVTFDLTRTQRPCRQTRALGFAPSTRPRESKTPENGFIFIEQNDLAPASAVLQGGEFERSPRQLSGDRSEPLRVAVSGPGIPTPIVAECPLPGPVTPQCEVTETPPTFLVTITLLVPVGPERLVVVTGFDQTGAESLRGGSTVDFTQPFQAVTIMLAPVQSNTPPRAHAGSDQTVAVGSTVVLLGNGSSDAEGDPLTFAWALLVRPPGSQAALSNPTSLAPTFVVDRLGVYMAQLIVNDGQVDSQPDVVMIDTVNSIPVANAGEAQTVTVGTTVTLQGNRSSDVDGAPLTFRWAFLTRPPGSQATLSAPTAVSPTFIVDRLGT